MKRSLSNSEILLILLSLVTGIIHVWVGYLSLSNTLILAGIGFLVGLYLFVVMEKFRTVIVSLSIPYTLSQIYFAYQSYGFNPTQLVIIDKIIQLALILTAIYYLSRNSIEFMNAR
ncbi:MAG: hypothetical protein ABEJ56_06415 [Candidatus Nanohaloarchaea archaeon]